MEPTITGQQCAYTAVVVGLSFLSLGLFACVAAMWRAWRLGYALYRESGYDWSAAWAEVHMVGGRNRELDRRMQAAMRRNAERKP
jgi:hypothetical protein